MKADLLVIGAGTGGLRTAMTAASNGTKTVLIGEGALGGTCLNTGCIPTKALLHAADVLRTCERAGEVGIKTTAKVDFAKVMERARSIVNEGKSHAEAAVARASGLTYIRGRASFVGPRTVEVKGKRITADKVIIATGSRPTVPPIPGLDQVPFFTTDDFLSLKRQPKHVILIGGGYIACEYATFLAAMGSKVTVLELAPDILGLLDEDMRAVVRESLEEAGVRLLTGTGITRVSHSKSRFTLSLDGADLSRVSGDCLLIATGRRPNTDNLDLNDTGVDSDKRGFIVVDKHMRTSVNGVYAIGDANGVAAFAHAAKRQGWIALEHALLGSKEAYPEHTPWAIFTHPPVAGFGFSESQLIAKKRRYGVLEASFSSCGKAKIIRQARGKIKVLHSRGHILGVSIAGPEADNLIHEFAALMLLGSKAVDALHRMIHVHPTLAEVAENLSPR